MSGHEKSLEREFLDVNDLTTERTKLISNVRSQSVSPTTPALLTTISNLPKYFFAFVKPPGKERVNVESIEIQAQHHITKVYIISTQNTIFWI